MFFPPFYGVQNLGKGFFCTSNNNFGGGWGLEFGCDLLILQLLCE